jgi:putative tricarboxylic transport membrane protein
VFLVTLSPPLSRWATSFGPWEYFGLVLMALVLIAAISQGSMVKGLISGTLGLMVAMPGFSATDGQLRLTFGFHDLAAGFTLLPVLLGVFVVSQIIRDAMELHLSAEPVRFTQRFVSIDLTSWRRHFANMLRSSVIGTWIGILPGVGASISAMIAYGVARSVAREPETFGQGNESGIVASEAANNANVSGGLRQPVRIGGHDQLLVGRKRRLERHHRAAAPIAASVGIGNDYRLLGHGSGSRSHAAGGPKAISLRI